LAPLLIGAERSALAGPQPGCSRLAQGSLQRCALAAAAFAARHEGPIAGMNRGLPRAVPDEFERANSLSRAWDQIAMRAWIRSLLLGIMLLGMGWGAYLELRRGESGLVWPTAGAMFYLMAGAGLSLRSRSLAADDSAETFALLSIWSSRRSCCEFGAVLTGLLGYVPLTLRGPPGFELAQWLVTAVLAVGLLCRELWRWLRASRWLAERRAFAELHAGSVPFGEIALSAAPSAAWLGLDRATRRALLLRAAFEGYPHPQRGFMASADRRAP
jgi:hypothetical protein